MYSVSNLWKSLVEAENHYFEYKARIAGTDYPENMIIGGSIDMLMLAENQPSVGGCFSGKLTLALLAPTGSIPRMAKIVPYVRATDGIQTAEWIPQGRFYVDTRETSANDDVLPILSLVAYDAMLRTEADYPDTSHNWPFLDILVVREIAATIGVEVDPRTVAIMTKGYMIGLPAGYSMREVLGNIGAMYAGNWIITYDEKLLLIPINGIPRETNYLVTGASDAITFGGCRILV